MRLDAALILDGSPDLIEPQVLLIPPDTAKITTSRRVRAPSPASTQPHRGPHSDRLVATLGVYLSRTRRRLAGDSTEGPLHFAHVICSRSAPTTRWESSRGGPISLRERPARIELEGLVIRAAYQ